MTNLAHQGIYGYHNNVQCHPRQSGWNASVSADYWTGLITHFQTDAIRAMGLAQVILVYGFGLLPQVDPAYAYSQAAMSTTATA